MQHGVICGILIPTVLAPTEHFVALKFKSSPEMQSWDCNLIIYKHRSNSICHFIREEECCEHWLDNRRPNTNFPFKDKSISLFRLLNKQILTKHVLLTVLSCDYRLTIICFHVYFGTTKREEEDTSFQIVKLNVFFKSCNFVT